MDHRAGVDVGPAEDILVLAIAWLAVEALATSPRPPLACSTPSGRRSDSRS